MLTKKFQLDVARFLSVLSVCDQLRVAALFASIINSAATTRAASGASQLVGYGTGDGKRETERTVSVSWNMGTAVRKTLRYTGVQQYIVVPYRSKDKITIQMYEKKIKDQHTKAGQ